MKIALWKAPVLLYWKWLSSRTSNFHWVHSSLLTSIKVTELYMTKEHSHLDLTEIKVMLKTSQVRALPYLYCTPKKYNLTSYWANGHRTDRESTDIKCTPKEPVPPPTMRPWFTELLQIMLMFANDTVV